MGSFSSKQPNDLQAEFEKIKNEGKNTTRHLIKWMKESQVIAKDYSDAAANKLFAEAKKDKVEFEEFMEALKKVAKEQKVEMAEVTSKLANVADQYLAAMRSAAAAFEAEMKKKKP